MNQQINNGDVFEAIIRFPNSIHSKNDVIVLVSKVNGIYRSLKDRTYYKTNNIVFSNKVELHHAVHKKYLKFNYYMLKGMKTYYITIVNRDGQYLSFIKYHGYSYKELREDHTIFDYSCSKDITEILRQLHLERKENKNATY